MIFQFKQDATTGKYSIPYTTDGIRKIHGTTPEWVANDASPLMDTLHPEDRQKIENYLKRSAQRHEIWDDEYRVILDGKVGWRNAYVSPEHLSDGTVIWHGFITDITERREMEQAMANLTAEQATLLSTIPVQVWFM
jgi:PAS domain S-box-containing protein